MMKIENTDVSGWEAAIRGMRNPMNSWSLSDSCHDAEGAFQAGEEDLALMQRLAKAGADHGKFLRMITVTADITAPLYWWKEYDTYKVGTVANSCSTMHKIHAKEFAMEDFSAEHLTPDAKSALKLVIDQLNFARIAYLETRDKAYWGDMIQLLPSSYNQRRTVLLNYEVLRRMHQARRNHKLDEWHTLCDWAEGLPEYRAICLGAEGKENV